MKLVIFAGGLGTRISEETTLKPKPMLEIGKKPILWHIMKIYSHQGINDFVICCGYKKEIIEKYFKKKSYKIIKNKYFISKQGNSEWRVELVNTGLNTSTGGRLKKIKNYIDDRFCLTYGDGLSDIDINKLIKYHIKNKKEITVTGINPTSKYGMLTVNKKNLVTNFKQKPLLRKHIINGGFLVCEKKIINYFRSNADEFEKVLVILSKKKQLMMYKHNDFWASMDTQRDRIHLNRLWYKKKAKWKIW